MLPTFTILCFAAAGVWVGSVDLDARAVHLKPTVELDSSAFAPQRALNLLLVPLMDDAEPAQWVDFGIVMNCADGAAVTVDGRPLMPDTPVPAIAFTLHWHLEDCHLFGAIPGLNGDATLTVFPEESGGYSAMVETRNLYADWPIGKVRWPARFAATTP